MGELITMTTATMMMAKANAFDVNAASPPQALLERLKDYGQEEAIAHWPQLSPRERQLLLHDLQVGHNRHLYHPLSPPLQFLFSIRFLNWILKPLIFSRLGCQCCVLIRVWISRGWIASFDVRSLRKVASSLPA